MTEINGSGSNGVERGNDGPLGRRLQGVQHFGVTVQNRDRAFEFYTEVPGGNEVMRHRDFHGSPIHNTILAHEEIIAHEGMRMSGFAADYWFGGTGG